MTGSDKYPKTVSPEQAEAFFREPGNFVGKYLEDIYQVLGYPNQWADWDRGRIISVWKDSHAEVWTQTNSSGKINYVEMSKPKVLFLLGGSKEVIWDDDS